MKQLEFWQGISKELDYSGFEVSIIDCRNAENGILIEDTLTVDNIRMMPCDYCLIAEKVFSGTFSRKVTITLSECVLNVVISSDSVGSPRYTVSYCIEDNFLSDVLVDDVSRAINTILSL